MLPEQWETFKRAARREKMDRIPMALIVDESVDTRIHGESGGY